MLQIQEHTFTEQNTELTRSSCLRTSSTSLASLLKQKNSLLISVNTHMCNDNKTIIVCMCVWIIQRKCFYLLLA